MRASSPGRAVGCSQVLGQEHISFRGKAASFFGAVAIHKAQTARALRQVTIWQVETSANTVRGHAFDELDASTVLFQAAVQKSSCRNPRMQDMKRTLS